MYYKYVLGIVSKNKKSRQQIDCLLFKMTVHYLLWLILRNINPVNIYVKTLSDYQLLSETDLDSILYNFLNNSKDCPFLYSEINKLRENKNWQAISNNVKSPYYISFTRLPKNIYINNLDIKNSLDSICSYIYNSEFFTLIGPGNGTINIGQYANYLYRYDSGDLKYFSEIYLINGKNASYAIVSNNTKINSIKDIVSSITEFSKAKIKYLRKNEINKSIKEVFNYIFKKKMTNEESDSILLFLTKYYTPSQDVEIQPKIVKIENCCSFELHPDLEIKAGNWKKVTDYVGKVLIDNYDTDRLWLQQKGLNDNIKGIRDHYIRISISLEELPFNSYQDPSKPIQISEEELNQLDSEIDTGIDNFKFAKIIKKEKLKVSKIGKYYALKKVFYSRMNDYPIKKSERYIFYKDSKAYNIFLEYWIPDFIKYRNSIDIFFKSLTILN